MNISDYDSIDLIVRNFPLAEIDRYAKASESIEGELPDNHEMKEWWRQRTRDLKLAADIAEYCIMNDIPTNDISPTPTRERGLYAIERCKSLEKVLTEVRADIESLRKHYTKETLPAIANMKKAMVNDTLGIEE